ncbi:lysine N(6)-hydroxylase/L-ornithine N(5)-oxygenase family protein [Streptomyces sp. NBC_00513]|uniref:FAD-dependent oxidoreductase n=1 Tax=unclassified Streptomyces TaxID=2593676 RepID=UPI00224F6D5C|nr:FAD-dependent oxidoreductase [Streptomyces sp. NBC_00424]MCX5076927.1 lysine N(6)-hydroxylase/L-ornithine N(5)-oxygenase family protein [Streptomyces sp. NBC_00424]WUD40066.1 lysine N(6)-hydroxylase/L-ornithine N(5)-oxygenase family protein [Streptomyces sp. NBC_00513]
MNASTEALPVAVIGAGPAGLAAAAHLTGRGIKPLVLEAGAAAAAAVREWGHVRLFSTWSELVDPAAEKLLAPTGWTAPEGATYPSGADWAALYLQPLADVLGERVRYGATVTGVSRLGRDRIVDADREQQPFTVRIANADGTEERILASAVIDASGTWSTPSPIGGDGLPALGEKAAGDRISYRIPDLKNPATRARYAGKRIAVIGSGASAFTTLAYLADLAKAEDATGTHATWILRRGISGSTFGGGSADQLPARGALGLAAKAAVDNGYADAVTGFRTDAIQRDSDGRLILVAEDGRRLDAVDEVIVLTGLRPDLSFVSELRLGLDERLQAPVELAPLIDPNQHSCGTVYPHGVNELSHPEQGVYLVGMKSYGRAPTFLAMTGYEQVRSIAAHLAGDQEAAERVELTLPETGVCGGAGLFDQPAAAEETSGGGCCAAPATLTVGAPAPFFGGC